MQTDFINQYMASMMETEPGLSEEENHSADLLQSHGARQQSEFKDNKTHDSICKEVVEDYQGMDTVYDPKALPPFVTQIVSPKLFHQQFVQFSGFFDNAPGSPFHFDADTDKGIISELKESIENGGPIPSETIPKEGMHLTVLKIQKEELEKRKKLSYRQGAATTRKYKRINFNAAPMKTAQLEDPLSIDEFTNYRPPSTLITVVVMRPYNRKLKYHEIRLGRLFKMDYTFLILGLNTLGELQRGIECRSDYTVSKEQKINDWAVDVMAPPTFSKDLYKGCFMYINGTFYNNTEGTDLSEPIVKWAKTRKKIGKFEKGTLDTKLEELTFRLGQPYLYQHQGECEHLLVFTDIRLMHPEDAQLTTTYPIVVSEKLKTRDRCVGCKASTAKFIQYGNKRVPMAPSFWCEKCLKIYNYDDMLNKFSSFHVGPV